MTDSQQITEYPGRYYTPTILMSPSFTSFLGDKIILLNPEHPGYIDAFIRQWRREAKRPLKWWQKLFR